MHIFVASHSEKIMISGVYRTSGASESSVAGEAGGSSEPSETGVSSKTCSKASYDH